MTRDEYIKYKINGIPAYRLLPLYKDYTYYRTLLKKGLSEEEAFKQTLATKSKDGHTRAIFTKTKYKINGKAVKALLGNVRDYGYFVSLIRRKHYSVEEAYARVMETKGKERSKHVIKYYYKGKPINEIFTDLIDKKRFYINVSTHHKSIEEAVKLAMRAKKLREKKWADYKAGKYEKANV